MINLHSTGGTQVEPKPRITVIGVGGAGGNAVNNMIQSHLEGVEFIVANTDAQALAQSRTDRRIQLGNNVTQGLGAGAKPEVGRAAAEEALDQVVAEIAGSNMVFITAGMGGGTGTGAAPVIARAAREHGILTVGVVTKPFNFEGSHRMRLAESGIEELAQYADTLIIIPNQNLFRVATAKTTFSEAFQMADDVLHSGVRGVTDLMVVPGLINLDFADIRTVMSEMGKAMMGTGEAEGENRALAAAEAAINNPLIEDISMKGAKSILINVTGGTDMTLFEADEAATRISSEVDPEANIIFGATFDANLEGKVRISIVATGIEQVQTMPKPGSTVTSFTTARKRIGAAPTGGSEVAVPRPAALAPAMLAHVAEVASAEPMFNLAAAHAEPAASVAELAAYAMGEPAAEAASYQTAPMLAEPAPVQALMCEPVQHQQPAAYRQRVEPRLDPAMAPQQAQIPASPPPVVEPARRSGGFFSNLMRGSAAMSHGHQPAAQAPAAQQPAARPAAAQPARPMPAPRPNPQDRQPARSHEEETLDIPAFLRRQAN